MLKSLPSVIKSPPSGHNWPKPIFNKVWLRRPLIRSLKMTIIRLTPGCCLVCGVCVVCNVLLFSQTLRRTATDWRHEQSLNKELGSEIPNIRIGHYDGRSQNAHGHAYEDWLPSSIKLKVFVIRSSHKWGTMPRMNWEVSKNLSSGHTWQLRPPQLNSL